MTRQEKAIFFSGLAVCLILFTLAVFTSHTFWVMVAQSEARYAQMNPDYPYQDDLLIDAVDEFWGGK